MKFNKIKLIAGLCLALGVSAFGQNNVGTLVTDPVRPFSVSSTHPSAIANEIKGGPFSSSNLVGLSNIPAPRLEIGSIGYATNTGLYYRLTATNPATWSSIDGINITNLNASNITGSISFLNISNALTNANVTFGNASFNNQVSFSSGTVSIPSVRFGSTNLNFGLFQGNLVGFGNWLGVVADGFNIVRFQSNRAYFDQPISFSSSTSSAALTTRTNLGIQDFVTNPVVQVVSGGTGATNAGGARTNLGLGVTDSVVFSNLTLSNGAQTNLALALGSTNRGLFTTSGPERINVVVEGSNVASFFSGSFEVNSQFSVVASAAIGSNLSVGGPISFIGASSNIAITRTNLGLGWPALTNSNAGTGLVSVNTNGEVVSPTNFWQAAPIQTLVQDFTLIGGTQTNNATNARNLYVYSLNTNLGGVSNTIILPTNTSTFNGDEVTVVHKGTTNTATVIRQAGSTNNLITLSRFDEAVKFIRESGQWDFYHNISFVEPVQFSGTNASSNAAASRTNLGLGATWLTNTNVTNFRTAIGVPSSFGSVLFSSIGGGSENLVSANYSSIGGGFDNFISNNATFGIIAGGANNTIVSGTSSAITGGKDNSVNGEYSQAGGFGAQITNNGAFVWSDSRTNIFSSTNDNSFNVEAIGGMSLDLGTNGIIFRTNASADATRTNLGLGSTNIVTFAGLTNNGDITINSTTSSNGLLYIRRTNNEAFLGLANLIASNNTTISNETLFRVGVSEATNKAAQFGFRSTNTNGNGVAVFSVFGYNALMMIGPSDPAAGTNPIEATVYSVNPTNKVMTLIKTNTGATLFHRAIEFENTTNQAVTRTNLGLGQTNNVTFSALTLSSDLTLGSGDNIVLSTTNGTKIGTATNQLLGFYNQTPITQPSSTGVTTNGFTGGSGSTVHPQSTFTGGIGTNAYTISDIVAHLKSLGLIAP